MDRAFASAIGRHPVAAPPGWWSRGLAFDEMAIGLLFIAVAVLALFTPAQRGHLLAPARRRRHLAERPRPARRSLFAHGVRDALAGSRVALAALDVRRLPGGPRNAGPGDRRRRPDPGRRGHRLPADGRPAADEVRAVDGGAADRRQRLVVAAADPDAVPAGASWSGCSFGTASSSSFRRTFCSGPTRTAAWRWGAWCWRPARRPRSCAGFARGRRTTGGGPERWPSCCRWPVWPSLRRRWGSTSTDSWSPPRRAPTPCRSPSGSSCAPIRSSALLFWAATIAFAILIVARRRAIAAGDWADWAVVAAALALLPLGIRSARNIGPFLILAMPAASHALGPDVSLPIELAARARPAPTTRARTWRSCSGSAPWRWRWWRSGGARSRRRSTGIRSAPARCGRSTVARGRFTTSTATAARWSGSRPIAGTSSTGGRIRFRSGSCERASRSSRAPPYQPLFAKFGVRCAFIPAKSKLVDRLRERRLARAVHRRRLGRAGGSRAESCRSAKAP